MQHFELSEIVRVDMTWQEGVPVHIYTRKAAGGGVMNFLKSKLGLS